ncbi:hypothetical protein [Arthrobacter sp. H16F315]|nr:hypothetical protein [Arthrobacter sp. H16F315]MDD1477868.1 hypothetical protein [Arthrobacter sp. H16F315]
MNRTPHDQSPLSGSTNVLTATSGTLAIVSAFFNITKTTQYASPELSRS